jgi:uncharacterized membrane protein YqjE
MSHPTAPPDRVTSPHEASLGSLVSDLSAQIPQLIRSEIRLAQAELTEKGKRAGIGIGMFSVAGLLAFFGFGVVVTACVLALALVLPGWAAALIVAAVLFIAAGVAALMGKKQVDEATPLVPERTVHNVKQDVEAAKEARR